MFRKQCHIKNLIVQWTFLKMQGMWLCQSERQLAVWSNRFYTFQTDLIKWFDN